MRPWRTLRVVAAMGLLPYVSSSTSSSQMQSDNEMIRLGMTKIARNLEIERLLANYERHSAPFDPSAKTLLAEQHHPTAVESRIFTGEGSHTIQVLVGGQPRDLIIDTGSGKTAFVCDGCRDCGPSHLHKPFRFTNETKYLPCNPHNLGDAEYGGCMECRDSKCKYGQRYVEGDYWEAYKVSDIMAFNADEPSFAARVEFGCIYEQTGCFTQQSSDGIMGFSRHPDSIFEQFYRQKATTTRLFAQCLSQDGGALTLGGVDMAVNQEPVMYTPLRDTGYQYWTVHLEKVMVGTVPLGISEAAYNRDRGCVFDSGTTFVYFPTAIESVFRTAWRQALGDDTMLPIANSFHHIPDATFARLPPICFHFTNNARLCVRPEAYLYRLAENEYAGTINFGDTAHSTIIGANALMHHNVIYDVDNERIGIAAADCDTAAAVVHSQQERVMLETSPGGTTFRHAVDREYWAQVGLASIALVAIVGLVNAVWMDVVEQRIDTTEPVADPEQTKQLEDDEESADAFAFFLMQDQDSSGTC